MSVSIVRENLLALIQRDGSLLHANGKIHKRKVCEATGVDYPVLRRILINGTTPQAKTLKLFADFFDVTSSELKGDIPGLFDKDRPAGTVRYPVLAPKDVVDKVKEGGKFSRVNILINVGEGVDATLFAGERAYAIKGDKMIDGVEIKAVTINIDKPRRANVLSCFISNGILFLGLLIEGQDMVISISENNNQIVPADECQYVGRVVEALAA